MDTAHEYFEVTDVQNKTKFFIDAGDISVQAAVKKYYQQQPNVTYVFRKMSEEEFLKTKAKGGLVTDNFTDERKGEKWITESLDHSKQFNNKGATGEHVTAEIEVDKSKYLSDTKKNSIPQKGSKAKQPQSGRPFNITNDERLKGHPKEKVNVGLKGKDNVSTFNESVMKIRKIEPDSLMNKNSTLRWLRRNKFTAGFIAVSAVLDAGSLVLSIIEDGGTVGPSTAVNVSEIVGGAVGAEVMAATVTSIASALGVILPGIGVAIGAFIGAVIGSIIAGGLMSFLVGVHKSVPGPGAPIPEGDLYPYVFGAPKPEIEQAHGPASTGNPTFSGLPSASKNPTFTGFPGIGVKTRPLHK